MMRVHIDNQPVFEAAFLCIAAGAGENFPRIGLDIELKQTCHGNVTGNAHASMNIALRIFPLNLALEYLFVYK
jgi:hypothetical protein